MATQLDDKMIKRNLENAEEKGIDISDPSFPLGAELKSKKPIRLKADSYKAFTGTLAGKYADKKSVFSDLSEQGYNDEFVSAVEKTFNNVEPTVEPINLDSNILDKLTETPTVNYEKIVKPEITSDEYQEIVKPEETEKTELEKIAGIISDSEINENIDKIRKQFTGVDEDRVEKIKPPIKPIRELGENKPITTISTEKNTNNDIDTDKMFEAFEQNIKKGPKESSEYIPHEKENSYNESYEERIARIKREIEEKEKVLAEQRQINATTTGAIESQRKIIESRQIEAEDLKAKNEQIEAENIAKLESLLAQTDAEYENEVRTGKNLEGELDRAEKDATLADSKLEELKAINDSLIKSADEVDELVKRR